MPLVFSGSVNFLTEKKRNAMNYLKYAANCRQFIPACTNAKTAEQMSGGFLQLWYLSGCVFCCKAVFADFVGCVFFDHQFGVVQVFFATTRSGDQAVKS